MGSMHIALLRGINVGGKHVLRMERLRTLFEQVGCEDVRTYIQSGNVVFRASAAVARRTPTQVADAIEREFAFTVKVVARSAKRWQEVIASNPFVDDCDPTKLHVAVLARLPSAAAVKGLDAERSPGDSFLLAGDVIYLHCPKGVARTKLTTAYFDKQLSTTCTMRNWRTTLKLGAMSSGEPPE